MDGVIIVRLMRDYKLLPEIRTLSNVLNALVRIRRFEMVLHLFDDIVSWGVVPDVYIHTAVVRSLCELKDFVRAKEVICWMESNGCNLSVVTT